MACTDTRPSEPLGSCAGCCGCHNTSSGVPRSPPDGAGQTGKLAPGRRAPFHILVRACERLARWRRCHHFHGEVDLPPIHEEVRRTLCAGLRGCPVGHHDVGKVVVPVIPVIIDEHLQHFLDGSVQPFHQPVGLWPVRGRACLATQTPRPTW